MGYVIWIGGGTLLALALLKIACWIGTPDRDYSGDIGDGN
jgi:hypothetical protein